MEQATDRKSLVHDLDIEPILPDDPDFKIAQDARESRKNGEQIYTLEQIKKELQGY